MLGDREVQNLIDSTQKVIGRNAVVEVEGIKRPLLTAILIPHHMMVSTPSLARVDQTAVYISTSIGGRIDDWRDSLGNGAQR
jgi:hypothetical protein